MKLRVKNSGLGIWGEVGVVKEGIRAIRRGEFIILFDDERENEGDLVLAAEAVTPRKTNFIISEARGILCVPLAGSTLDRLRIPVMAPNGNGSCKFTVTVDAQYGITTGSSAHDRAHTINLLADPKAGPEDFVQPGHVFPLRASDGGLQARLGHTEGSLELVRAAGCFPAAVICEILGPQGEMADREEVARFAERHSMFVLTMRALRKHFCGG